MGFLELQILPNLRGKKISKISLPGGPHGVRELPENTHKIFKKICLPFIIWEESVTPTPSLRNPSSVEITVLLK